MLSVPNVLPVRSGRYGRLSYFDATIWQPESDAVMLSARDGSDRKPHHDRLLLTRLALRRGDLLCARVLEHDDVNTGFDGDSLPISCPSSRVSSARLSIYFAPWSRKRRAPFVRWVGGADASSVDFPSHVVRWRLASDRVGPG